ncbi:MAG: rod shape-determining protein RodA [Candidatus Zixiibacteriota bacterium]
MSIEYRQLDWKLIAAALILSLIGILLIMAAQYHADDSSHFLKQFIWLAVALGMFAVVIHLPLRLFDVTAYLFYAISVGLLILVLLVGTPRMGALRWFSFGPVNLTPSDIAKVTLVLALSRYLAYSKLQPTSTRRLAVTVALVLVPVLLIIRQPDLGTSLVFLVVLCVLWFWGGLSPVYLGLILSPIIALIVFILSPLENTMEQYGWVVMIVYFALLLAVLFFVKPRLSLSVLIVAANLAAAMVTQLIWNRLAQYQKDRLETFLNPASEPQGAGYQIIQSKIAIGSGGLTGKGLLQGSQTRLDFLPEAHTDFIFSVLGEELGLVGALVVLLLFFYIFYRAVRIAARCRSRFASYVVMGATSILLFQFFINVGMALGFMPVTGLALPFTSYGGTSLVLCWSLIALIVSADYHWQEY